MKLSKRILGLLLAAFVLFGCMPVFAADPDEADKPVDKPEAAEVGVAEITSGPYFSNTEAVDVFTDTFGLASLTEAVNYANAANMLKCSTQNDEWIPHYDNTVDMKRTVARANVPSNNGTYTRKFTVDEFDVDGSRYYMLVFKGGAMNIDSFTVKCLNTATDGEYELSLNSALTNSWGVHAARLFPSGFVTGTGGVSIEFSVTFTVTSSVTPACVVTDLAVYSDLTFGSACNAPDCDFVYNGAQDNTHGSPMLSFVPNRGISAVNFSGMDDDYIKGITTHVVAQAGDVLSYDYVSDLDYMNGATFQFGLGTSYRDMEVLYEGEESGDGSLWYDWEHVEYTIPATGEYDFIWVLAGSYTEDSYAYLRNVTITPRMTRERILENTITGSTLLSNMFTNARFEDSDDTPWYPVVYDGEVCMRSGSIGHGGKSTLLSKNNLLKAGDLFRIRFRMSSEEDYDWFRLYMVNELTGERIHKLSQSGIDSEWVSNLFSVPADGLYTFELVYEKDGSVSQGNDCIYVDFFGVPLMQPNHAVYGAEDNKAIVTNWPSTDGRYWFRPALVNGELVIASTNQGVRSSSSITNIWAELEAHGSIEFKYMIDAEANYEKLYIYVNEALADTIPARVNEWQTYRFTAETAGAYTIKIEFRKDISVDGFTDTAYVKDVVRYNDRLNEAALDDYNGVDLLDHNEDMYFFFDAVEVDDRLAVGFAGDDEGEQAGFYHYAYINAYEYVAFDYKLTDDATITFKVDGELEAVLQHEDDNWHTYYYRVPQSGQHRYDWIGNVFAVGATVYIDNVHIGRYMRGTYEEILMPGTGYEPMDFDYDESEGFSCCWDPLEPRGYTEYAFCAYEEGDAGVLAWDKYMLPNDKLRVGFSFMDEDEVPNGSWVEVYIDGELWFDFNDGDVYLNRWYGLPFTSYVTGTHHFELVYHSEAQAGGDSLAVCWIAYLPIECTLDEALNVEGGTIHFDTPNGEGSFIPIVEDDIAYAAAYGKYGPEEPINYVWDFESQNELEGWTFIDSDGDGYGWEIFDTTSTSVCIDAEDGDCVLSSASYTYETAGLDPDNWAISPVIHVPEDSLSTNIWFLFAGFNETWYAEHFGVYVGTGDDVSEYTLIYETTISSSGWKSLSFDIDKYAGQDVRIAIRHYDSPDVYRLFIDRFEVFDVVTASADVSFELDVDAGDTLSFDVSCMTNDPDYCTSNYLMLYDEDGTLLTSVNAYNHCQAYSGDEWVTYTYTFNRSGHYKLTFRQIDYDGDESVLTLLLDNVQLIKGTTGLFGDVNCDGYVTFSDVAALYSYIMGSNELSDQGRLNADMNGDGQVTFADVAALYNYILGGGSN